MSNIKTTQIPQTTLSILIFLLGLLGFNDLSAQEEWINIISPEQINEIKEIDGKYYCATNGGLVIYDPATEDIQRYTVKDGLPSQRIEDVTVDQLGLIWIGTYENGIAFLEEDGWQHVPAPPTDLNITQIYCIEFDNQGFLWAGTERGTFKYVDEEWQATEVLKCWDMEKSADGTLYFSGPWPNKVKDGILTQYFVPVEELTYSKYSCVEYDSDGKLYWGNNRGGFAIIPNIEPALNFYDWSHFESEEFGLVDGIVASDIEILDDATVWVVFENGWFFRLDGFEWTKVFEREDLAWPQLDKASNGDVLVGSGNKLFKINESLDGLTELIDLKDTFETNESEIAVNEYGHVLVINDNRLFKNDGIDLSFSEIPPLSGKDNYAGLTFLEYPDKSLAFYEELTRTIYKDNQIMEVVDPLDFFPPEVFEFTPLNTFNIMIDSFGEIWLTTNKGVFHKNQTGVSLYNESNSPVETVGIPGTGNYLFAAIAEDRNGNIWINSPKGMATWNRATTEWDYITIEESNGISMTIFLDMYFDEDNILWGTGYSGLVRYDGLDWTVYNNTNSELPDNRINQIFPWEDDLILVATHGISYFDGESFYKNFDKSNSGLGSNHCEKLVVDFQGNFWIDHIKFSILNYGGISVYKEQGVSLNTHFIPEELPDFKVFPNPSSEKVNIILPKNHLNVNQLNKTIRIINVQGQTVFSRKYDMKEFSADWSIEIGTQHLVDGLYLLEISDKEQIRTIKIIKSSNQ